MTLIASARRALRPPSTGWWIVSYGHSSSREEIPHYPETLISRNGENRLSLALVDDCSVLFAADSFHSVIFDGVLYNRRELQDGLSSDPNLADADIILHAYHRWKDQLFSKLKGVFTLFLSDNDRNVLFCVRDPLGVHPLYYSDTGGEILFSNSINILFHHPNVPRKVNRVIVAERFCNRWPRLDETYFENVFRVPPGHLLELSRAGRRIYRYWEPLSTDGTKVDWIQEHVSERFDELFNEAVKRCLDFGPAGIFLSGGLDSVSIAAVAADHSRDRSLAAPLALSIVFPDSACEEPIQKGVASALELPQILRNFTDMVESQGLLGMLAEVSVDWPWPILNPWLPIYRSLAIEAKQQGYDVVLSGEGGDEWLAVTPYYAADLILSGKLLELYRLGVYSYRSWEYSVPQLTRHLLWRFGLRPLLSSAARGAIRKTAPGILRKRWRVAIPNWLAPDPQLRQEIMARQEREIEENLVKPRSRGCYIPTIRAVFDSVLRAMEMEEDYESSQRLGMRKLAPFWDAELVHFLLRTPPSVLNRGGRSKGLVRDMLARRFPGLGFERQKKVLLQNLFPQLLLKEGRPLWQAMAEESALVKMGIAETDGLQASMEYALAGTVTHNRLQHAYNVLNLEMWLQPQC